MEHRPLKFALVNGQRAEAQPSLEGECVGCGGPAIAKCGEVRMWHWAHRGKRTCDLWWENETEWHRAWKNEFPPEWQEIRHRAPDGEWHIADVKTRDGWVVEFQHSHLNPEERHSRECFYQSMIWVVDGTRRSHDIPGFAKSVARGKALLPVSTTLRVPAPSGALLRDWRASEAHVFFDFGRRQRLWWLYPGSDEERAYVHPLSRDFLLKLLLESGWRELESEISRFGALIGRHEPPPTTRAPPRAPPLPPPPGWLPSIRRSTRL